VSRCAQSEKSVYLLGSRPGVASRAAERLVQRYPALIVAGSMHGYFTHNEEPRVVQQIQQAKPDVLLVGMGTRQEKWIAANKQLLGARLLMGVGGSFDVISGSSRRAPRWMQRMHLEWFYRLLTQPWRWRRQLVLVSFACRVMTESRRSRG